MTENIISIIVCTYRQENTIARTLDSLLMQQCHLPMEIIIGEDCSPDGTLAICRQYEQQHPDVIRVIANNPNKGLLDNYYDCIFAARGKYIADCAGDDYWCDPLKLEKEVTILEQHPDVGIVHTAWRPGTEQGMDITQQVAGKAVITDGSTMLEDILTQSHRPVIHLCTSLYRTDWVREMHDEYRQFFRNNDYPCEDLQLCFLMARRGKVAYIPDVTLSYTIAETLSNSTDERRLFRFFSRATTLVHDLAVTFSMNTPRVQRFLRKRTFAMYMHAFRLHDTSLRTEAMRFQQQWSCGTDTRIRLVQLITSNSITWNIMLLLRTGFVFAKKCLS